jgi:hypothetical protein
MKIGSGAAQYNSTASGDPVITTEKSRAATRPAPMPTIGIIFVLLSRCSRAWRPGRVRGFGLNEPDGVSPQGDWWNSRDRIQVSNRRRSLAAGIFKSA